MCVYNALDENGLEVGTLSPEWQPVARIPVDDWPQRSSPERVAAAQGLIHPAKGECPRQDSNLRHTV